MRESDGNTALARITKAHRYDRRRMTAPSAAAPLTLSDLHAIPVTALKGSAPRRPTGLEELGVTTVLDLLTYYPRRWVDRTNEATHRRPPAMGRRRSSS